MPELPEVTTTVNGLNEVMPHKTILDVWSDYFIGSASKRLDTIKNKKYFEYFRKEIIGHTVKSAERKGKNVLIHLSNEKTILIHMKMTGHLLYGNYYFEKNKWKSNDQYLSDPFSRFIHLIFTLSDGKFLAFSDMRKFAKVTLFETEKSINDLIILGPDPMDKLSLKDFENQIHKKITGKIKTVLMDQTILGGIGNIYSDEILWQAGIHPERIVRNISKKEINLMWKAMLEILNKSIQMGGDSMSDYRNIHGQKGNFQKAHKVYKRNKEKCLKKNCSGIIQRIIIGGRSSHFCGVHQKI